MPRTSVDYADYNITIYRHCPYQCLYCWAWRVPLNAKRIQSGRYDPVMEAEKIARKCRKRERVVVSFTSDPYPFQEAWMNTTRWVIAKLRRYGCPTVMMLTKNPVLALKDRDTMLSHIVDAEYYVETWLGTTITSAFDPTSIIIEQNAPRTSLRLRALREYQNQGGYVWISIEPIIPIEQPPFYPSVIVKKIIDTLDPEKIKLVVLGRLNYIHIVKKYLPELPSEDKATYFYKWYVPEAVDILKEHSIPFHIKKELQRVIK